MGLDQYLYQHPIENIDTAEPLCYWRKSNQIHAFFDGQAPGIEGLDNCERLTVTKPMLEELVDRCKKVLENHDLAPELLPVSYGFFFGSDKYDEYYFEDLEETIKMLEPVIESWDETKTYVYHGWW